MLRVRISQHSDLLTERGLIVLDRQDVAGPLIENGLGDELVASHGIISGDDASRQLHDPGKLRNGRDLIGFLLDLGLSQDKSIGCRLGTDHVKGLRAQRPVVRASRGLPFNGYYLAFGELTHRSYPIQETVAELFRI